MTRWGFVAALAVVLGFAAPVAAQPGAPTGAVAPQECLVAEVIAQDCGPELLGLRIAITDGADATECGKNTWHNDTILCVSYGKLKGFVMEDFAKHRQCKNCLRRRGK